MRKRIKAGDTDLVAMEAKARGGGGLAKLSMSGMRCLLQACMQPVGGKWAGLAPGTPRQCLWPKGGVHACTVALHMSRAYLHRPFMQAARNPEQQEAYRST